MSLILIEIFKCILKKRDNSRNAKKCQKQKGSELTFKLSLTASWSANCNHKNEIQDTFHCLGNSETENMKVFCNDCI